MTQYEGGFLQEKALSKPRDTIRATDNLELLQAVTMLREDDLDEAGETAETKGEFEL